MTAFSVRGPGGSDLQAVAGRTSSNEPANDIVRAYAGGFRIERGDNPMPQDGQRHRPHVVGGRVMALVQQGPRLGRQQQIDAGARAGAPLHHLLQVLRELALFGPRHAGQRDRVLVNVVAHRNLADQRLQLRRFRLRSARV